MQKQILLLGGSSEAFTLAQTLEQHPKFQVISSLAGRTSLPRKPVGTYRTGGFGGLDGLITYIQTNAIEAIIDATHPFATKMSQTAHQAALTTNTPILHLWRPTWQKTPDDTWIEVGTMQEAATALQTKLSPAFLTIGRLELAPFLSRPDIDFLVRAIEPPKKSEQKNQSPPQSQEQQGQEQDWPTNFSFIYAKGPFNESQERELIEKHNIKTIITKNSGGPAAYAKLEVARELNLPVIMVNRPPKPNGPTVATVDEAINWLEKTL